MKMLPNLWTDHLVKIIDSVHLHNHKRDSCKTDFNPKIVKSVIPNANTMICEVIVYIYTERDREIEREREGERERER